VSEVTFKVSKAYYLKSVLNGDRANKEWWYFTSFQVMNAAWHMLHQKD